MHHFLARKVFPHHSSWSCPPEPRPLWFGGIRQIDWFVGYLAHSRGSPKGNWNDIKDWWSKTLIFHRLRPGNDHQRPVNEVNDAIGHWNVGPNNISHHMLSSGVFKISLGSDGLDLCRVARSLNQSRNVDAILGSKGQRFLLGWQCWSGKHELARNDMTLDNVFGD